MKPGEYKVVWDGGSDWMKGTALFSVKSGKSKTIKFPGKYVPDKVEIKINTKIGGALKNSKDIWVFRKSGTNWLQEWHAINKSTLNLKNRKPGTYKIIGRRSGYLETQIIREIPRGRIETIDLKYYKLIPKRF